MACFFWIRSLIPFQSILPKASLQLVQNCLANVPGQEQCEAHLAEVRQQAAQIKEAPGQLLQGSRQMCIMPRRDQDILFQFLGLLMQSALRMSQIIRAGDECRQQPQFWS